ncbi:MAG: VWA domain-containing protein [Acidobacteriota bacterium]|nr:VWA domain-containing protein [Acidobacteriota bacterium]
MKIKRQKAKGKNQKSLALIVLLLAVLIMLPVVHSQSGRPGQDPKKTKPEVTPPNTPQPKIRVPENPPQKPPKKKEEEDTIRIDSDLVTVVTSISKKSPTDSLNLTAADFEILEDGVPQEIANFARDSEQPLNLVMLFDSSLSVTQKINFEKRAAAKFFERVIRPQDRAALFAVSTDVEIIQDFTNKPAVLVNATKQLKPKGATSLYDAIYLAANYLNAAPGRRVIVIVSDGGDTTSQKGLLDALRQTQLSDAVVFSVFTGNFGMSQNLRDLAGERALETLATETGGEVFRPKATPGTQSDEVDDLSLKELDKAFASLAEQLRTQFILGFLSTNEKRDGTFRKLTVRIKKEGYTARARAGYYAPKE